MSHVKECETLLREQIEEKILPLDSRITQRGIGMIHGIDFSACGIENPAVRIERDVEDLYKAEYMHNHLGEVYMGTVAGITPRGVFVELENTVEGFVPAAELCKGEPQVVDGVSMVDPLTGRTWMLGTSMKIRVAAADVALGRIDFEYMVE